MNYFLFLIIKSHLTLLSLAFLLYVLEKSTGYVHFYSILLRQRKNEDEIKTGAIVYGFFYFMFMLMMLLADAFIAKKIPEGFSFSIWLYIVFVLSMIICKVYYDYHFKRLKSRNN